METKTPETVKTECKFGTIEVTKSNGYELKFTPYGVLNGYKVELGDTDTGELSPADFTQSFQMAGAPFEFICTNTSQQQILDALKALCTGTDLRYVLLQLNKIPR